MDRSQYRQVEEANNTAFAAGLVETLEPRQLLSAAPLATPLVADRSHVVAPPLIVGIFPGDYTNTKTQATGVLDITVISQTSSDKIFGSVIILDNSYRWSGSINSKGRFSFHGAFNHQTVRASGTATPDGNTLVGRFSFSQKHGSFEATFSAGKAS